MSIAPDTKDWTWVLQRPCPECGLAACDIAPSSVAPTVRSNARAWARVLESECQHRPAPDVWSPLEYACHVRDVLQIYDVRLLLMLEQDDPLFANWDQDATALDELYAEQDPAVVTGELTAAANVLANRFEQVAGDQWQRSGRRSDGAEFTVASFARYFLHDIEHHLVDVGQQRTHLS